MYQALLKQLQADQQTFIDIRRQLHMHPELSFQEEATPAYIAEQLASYGISHIRTGVGGRGVVATVTGTQAVTTPKTVALRADFDALPIQDQKNVPYKSTVSGAMHACGHDAHTASLLAVAKVVSNNRGCFGGSIRFIFQHAEEVQPGGAVSMIADGCLTEVDAIFGNHVASDMPLGYGAYAQGPIMANSDFFDIMIQGKGGHAGYPHTTLDPVLMGVNAVQAFQQIVTRQVQATAPAVLSVTKFEAGTAFNIIPDKVTLGGTVRTYDSDTQATIIRSMEQILMAMTHIDGASYTLNYTKGYPAVINTPAETNLVKQAMTAIGLTALPMSPRMGGEDFAYYLQQVPGSFFYTGAAKDKTTNYPHHHPLFDIDEQAILIASKLLLTAALGYLEGLTSEA